jgi:hypothetical protein
MQALFPNTTELINQIFNNANLAFDDICLQVFRFQYYNNSIYRKFVNALNINEENVDTVAKIPFLPISFFKSHQVVTTNFEPEHLFESSGTTGSVNSKHLIKSLALYKQSFTKAFELFYGNPADWCIIGLLPSYLERQTSSLVVMVDELIKQSGDPQSGFYLYDHEKLHTVLQELEAKGKKTLLIGVTFALLDFAEKYSMQLKSTIVMETGGMKGRREEWTREEVHEFLMERLGVNKIHSEYGMTELLSQAYSSGNGIFSTPPWMKIVLREEDDPLSVRKPSDKTINGVINVIDLANIYSCSFIATEDVGKLFPNGDFKVLGRLDNSDVRGCSLMAL